ncbi:MULTISPECIES: HAD hydrolase family protein [unclassified Arcicella]|uniref:KdsC family phosphatase n=1 Tax=unclassified Arcicella TaxID=2644986 RepID=UPI0028570AA4|nr:MULTISPECIES: HAD hydrolase family protein [unclassified Arcicella]MDR6561407.1 YrbI family 3-deoxy-D-manno-octulosonate 8-phosphate phosphatase [Arcicella sp. BE51]MDR6811291.1 YrbI family 3-deoxy-D-manno-octulosonate 8-phosphate phosphatase [Arcicella sp. BE140]MDR6822641.1 YrbI family 3-deoxy-D-manno-octulosonate 8-phosphate phosphatase [Arcicella sp. BE139]
MNIHEKAKHIKLLITDCDGVLTDAGVYYGENGEVLKKFNIRDGMGVERLRKSVNVETAIITGEVSPSVVKRAEKLKITELHLGIKDKLAILTQIMVSRNLTKNNIAYIGDDVNDIEIMQNVGLTACPNDAISFTKEVADYICQNKGGEGCFREFAELIIAAQS